MPVLASYCDQPKDIKFRDQEDDEIVEMFLRQHPIVNLPWILTSLFLLLVLSG